MCKEGIRHPEEMLEWNENHPDDVFSLQSFIAAGGLKHFDACYWNLPETVERMSVAQFLSESPSADSIRVWNLVNEDDRVCKAAHKTTEPCATDMLMWNDDPGNTTYTEQEFRKTDPTEEEMQKWWAQVAK